VGVITHIADLSVYFAPSPTLINFGKPRLFLDGPHRADISKESEVFSEDCQKEESSFRTFSPERLPEGKI
jgi:hypothetical protein